MTHLKAASAMRLAARRLESGRATIHGVVIGGPDNSLLGRHVVRVEGRLLGDLGDPDRNDAALAALAAARGVPRTVELADGTELYVETFAPAPELVIVGAGHIAQPLATVGKLLGFTVSVLDDRPEFARADRFPDADRVLAVDFTSPLATIEIDGRSHVVLVTRGHRYDYDALLDLHARDAKPAYVGMIGSRRRVRAAFEQLVKDGVDREWLSTIRAPIGLDVNAETPAEIAVAIGAEIVQVARGGTGRPLAERDVLRYVRSEPEV